MPLQKSTNKKVVKEFYGNFLTSGPGIFLIVIVAGFTLLFIAGFIPHRDAGDSVLILFVILGFYAGFGVNLFYFRITDTHLEVRNHVFPGFGRKYRLEEIESVIFEKEIKRSDILRIKKKSGSLSWGYSAGSLRRKNWNALAQALRNRDISVDNRH